MRIKNITIKNYKCFGSVGPCELSEGINIVVGKNNSGKSSFLELASVDFFNIPHANLTSKPEFHTSLDSMSVAHLEFELTQEDFRHFIRVSKKVEINRTLFGTPEIFSNVFKELLSFPTIKFAAQFRGRGRSIANDENKLLKYVMHSFGFDNNVNGYYSFQSDEFLRFENGPLSLPWQTTNNGSGEIGLLLSNHIKERIYKFTAQRYNVANHPPGLSTVLSTNAANLPEVLHNLMTINNKKFDRYLNYVKRVLPFVKYLNVSLSRQNNLQIGIWTHEPETERSDLVIPLDECGTGVGQVLAILYVVVASDSSEIIIIDEPNSFLHPEATRELINIFKEFIHHQYIISTHSPEVISSSDSENIISITNDSNVASIEVLKKGKDALRKLFTELGVKLSDVFGYEKIVWVEGPTEELFFPELIDRKKRRSVIFKSVKNTGDFESKKIKPKLIYDVYERISVSGHIVPQVVGFVFDREKRKPEEILDLEKSSKGLAKFLNVRMFENYLLKPECLYSYFCEKYGIAMKYDDFHSLFTARLSSKEYDGDQKNNEETANAGKFLSDFVQEITDGKYSYVKTEDSVEIGKRILTTKPDVFNPLKSIIESCLNE